jgi:predicted NAD-dependent protein-ADP-ribosyltransferase YbiA (DUF1768 family)
VDEDGVVNKTNEHYCQAQKTLDPEKRQWILDSPDPATVKRRGNHKGISLRPDWETFKFYAMMDGLRMKISGRRAPIDRSVTLYYRQLSCRILSTG